MLNEYYYCDWEDLVASGSILNAAQQGPHMAYSHVRSLRNTRIKENNKRFSI